MRQILLDTLAERYAQWYSKLLRNTGVRQKSLENIDHLISVFQSTSKIELYAPRTNDVIHTFRNGNAYVNYLNLLKFRYDALKTVHPVNFIKEIRAFEQIIPVNLVTLKMSRDNSPKSKSFSELIVNAMMYDKVRTDIYPAIARALELKTCVYCNANFTINDKGGNGYYDLDHWKPKSLYPYLCTSFFNLQPSCPSCNRRKKDDDLPYFGLWDDTGKKNRSIVGMNLTHKSIIDYLCTHDQSDLRPVLFIFNSNRKDDQKIRDNMEDRLHIEERYLEHCDVAEEVIWKSQVYTSSFINSLRDNFGHLVPTDAEIERFILGTYSHPDDIHKRPLTSFMQNIGRQLKLLK